MKNKLLLYNDRGKSHLRVISKNAALAVQNCEDMFKTDNNSFELSVSYDSIDDVFENLDTIIKDAVEQFFDGDFLQEESYHILTADSEHAVAEFHGNNSKKEDDNNDVNDLLSTIYKIVSN
jgi:hypothetical protein